uniref:Uncharacterized protein n=1 Tax=Glossina pallidipes TaxID=7398 RepID=A0A1A9ZYM4_GLOPL
MLPLPLNRRGRAQQSYTHQQLRGLEDLEKLCDHTITTFEAEIKAFNDKDKIQISISKKE